MTRTPEGLVATFALTVVALIVLGVVKAVRDRRVHPVPFIGAAALGGLGGFFAWALRDSIDVQTVLTDMGIILVVIVVGLGAARLFHRVMGPP